MELTLKEKADKIADIQKEIKELNNILKSLNDTLREKYIGYTKIFSFFSLSFFASDIKESFRLDDSIIKDFKSCIQRRKEDLEHELDLLIV